MDDLISRKELLKRLGPEYKNTARLIQSGETHLDNLAEGFTEVKNLIESAMAVEAEPVRHGRWVFDGLWEECSGCGYAISVDDKRTNYCPNCGAKMDLEGGNGAD